MYCVRTRQNKISLKSQVNFHFVVHFDLQLDIHNVISMHIMHDSRSGVVFCLRKRITMRGANWLLKIGGRCRCRKQWMLSPFAMAWARHLALCLDIGKRHKVNSISGIHHFNLNIIELEFITIESKSRIWSKSIGSHCRLQTEVLVYLFGFAHAKSLEIRINERLRGNRVLKHQHWFDFNLMRYRIQFLCMQHIFHASIDERARICYFQQTNTQTNDHWTIFRVLTSEHRPTQKYSNWWPLITF